MSQTTGRNYVYPLDFVRAITILAVVAVHAVRFGLVPSHPVAGGLVQLVFQWGRISFMVVTGFIVAYQYRDKNPRWWAFFGRRARSAGAPYLLWLALFLLETVPIWPLGPFLQQYLQVLPQGNGHLYYMIITFQMYLLTPVLIWTLRTSRQHMRWIVLAAMVWEVLSWTATGYFRQSLAPPLWVTTYVGYFIVGASLGYYWPIWRARLASHRVLFRNLFVPALAVVAAAFFIDDRFIGGLFLATSMFQPSSVLFGLFMTMTLLAGGTWFEEVRPGRLRLAWAIGIVADASFGIYLVHPLFVHGWLDLAQAMHWHINSILNTGITFAAGVVLSLVVVWIIRLLPFSEYLIGTKRRRNPRVNAATSTSTTVVS